MRSPTPEMKLNKFATSKALQDYLEENNYDPMPNIAQKQNVSLAMKSFS